MHDENLMLQTHSESVIIIAFPRQKRALMLRYMYIACPVQHNLARIQASNL